MVAANRKTAFVLDPDKAPEPPVRAVESVRMMGRDGFEACLLEALEQLAAPVDAQVSARNGVVALRQRPVDELRAVARHGYREHAARLQDPGELGHGRGVVAQVLEHLRTYDLVEGTVHERQPHRVGPHAGAGPALFDLAGLGHRRHHRDHPGDLARVGVEGDDHRTPAKALEGVTAPATAQVEHALVAAQPKAVEVDSQHASSS